MTVRPEDGPRLGEAGHRGVSRLNKTEAGNLNWLDDRRRGHDLAAERIDQPVEDSVSNVLNWILLAVAASRIS